MFRCLRVCEYKKMTNIKLPPNSLPALSQDPSGWPADNVSPERALNPKMGPRFEYGQINLFDKRVFGIVFSRFYPSVTSFRVATLPRQRGTLIRLVLVENSPQSFTWVRRFPSNSRISSLRRKSQRYFRQRETFCAGQQCPGGWSVGCPFNSRRILICNADTNLQRPEECNIWSRYYQQTNSQFWCRH